MNSPDENAMPLAPGCRLTVVIPARNEARYLGAALAALSRQVDLSGALLARDAFDVIVFANNCRDDTAALARRCAAERRLRLYVVEGCLPARLAHIGSARKQVMDLAAARFFAAGVPDGLIASTDSDTVVADDWVAATLFAAVGVDAVAGQVALALGDQQRLLAPVRLLYARELTYRRLLAEIEAQVDPLPEDPLPRHSSFVGASFAVRAASYVAAGALPPLPRLEDLHFERALCRIDAKIRHSTAVRASTSSRVRARVAGGFGSFIADLHASAARGESFLVEHPQATLDSLSARAALRRQWSSAAIVREPFGRFYERAVADISAVVYPRVPVETAINGLRAAAQRGLGGDSLARDAASSTA